MNNIRYFIPFRLTFIHISAVFILFSLSSQVSLSQNGLMAEYFDGKNFDRFVSAAYVDNIDDTWNDIPPVAGIDPHDCSIRWTAKLRPGKTATYLFSAFVDDGIRVWIDDHLVIDQWGLNDVGVFDGKMKLTAHTDYNLKVEYFNALREGEIKLLWDIEKSKEEQSWYERFFGVEYAYSVIKSEYFYRPEIPLTKIGIPLNNVSSEKTIIVKKDQITPAKEKSVKSSPSSKKITEVTVAKKTKTSPAKKENKAVLSTNTLTQPSKEIITAEVAKKYIPKNVQFKRAKADILPSSIAELNTFANFLLENTNIKISIEGHTENVGDPIENQKLSERRAVKVARYFVEQGVDASRLKTKGYGGTRPLKIPKKGEYCPQNRRVVFILSGLD